MFLAWEPGKILERYASLLIFKSCKLLYKLLLRLLRDACLEKLAEALRSLFFERAEEANVQEQEDKRRKQEQELVELWLLLRYEEQISSFMIQLLTSEPSPEIQIPGMIGRRTSKG
jgi:hypothetical protein